MTDNEDSKEIVRTGYDNIASSYLDFISALPSPNIAWTDRLLAALKNPSSAVVLELGCGNGVPCTTHLAPTVGHLVANDVSSSQISLAKEKLADHTNIEYLQGDMTMLSLPSASLDAVSVLYSLVHLPLVEQPKMLTMIHDWLKPSGLLLCNFDVEADPGSIMDDWLGTRMFKAGYGVEGSKTMVIDAGFEMLAAEVVEEVDGKKTVPFLWVLSKKSERS